MKRTHSGAGMMKGMCMHGCCMYNGMCMSINDMFSVSEEKRCAL